MTKTTEGERASIMGEHKLHGKDIILRLVQDADRLVAIERQVRELAAKWRTEARRSFGRGTEYHAQIGQLKQRMASELESIIDPPDEEG